MNYSEILYLSPFSTYPRLPFTPFTFTERNTVLIPVYIPVYHPTSSVPRPLPLMGRSIIGGLNSLIRPMQPEHGALKDMQPPPSPCVPQVRYSKTSTTAMTPSATSPISSTSRVPTVPHPPVISMTICIASLAPAVPTPSPTGSKRTVMM